MPNICANHQNKYDKCQSLITAHIQSMAKVMFSTFLFFCSQFKVHCVTGTIRLCAACNRDLNCFLVCTCVCSAFTSHFTFTWKFRHSLNEKYLFSTPRCISKLNILYVWPEYFTFCCSISRSLLIFYHHPAV